MPTFKSPPRPSRDDGVDGEVSDPKSNCPGSDSIDVERLRGPFLSLEADVCKKTFRERKADFSLYKLAFDENRS